MAKPPDRVVPIKQESAATGGDAADSDPFLGTLPLDPSEDAINTAGVAYQEPTGGGANSNDSDVIAWRESGKQMFCDQEVPAGVSLLTLTTGGSLPTPDEAGQVLYACDASSFTKVLPITNDYGWMVNEGGLLLANG